MLSAPYFLYLALYTYFRFIAITFIFPISYEILTEVKFFSKFNIIIN